VQRVVDAGAQLVLTSGNHDSAIRLGFASELLSRAGLHIRSSVGSVGVPVVVEGVAVYPLPYLEPSVAAPALDSSERTHAGVLGAAMQRVRADVAKRGLPSVVMAHAFVTGGATSESERDISVGGVSAVPPSVFEGVDYAALGHLHGRQQVAEGLRYSGSPVAMSFGEWRHTKGSWLVDLDASGVRVDAVPAPVHRRLAVLRGDLEELLTDPRHEQAEAAWCQVTLTDPVRPLGAMERLRRRFPHTLVLQFDPQGAAAPVRRYADRPVTADPVDVCCDFLGHVRGGAAATEDEREVLAEAVEAVRLERGLRDDEGRATGAAAGDRARDRGVA